MSDIKLACPDCKQHIAAPEEMAGQSVNCPTCNKILQIPERSTVIPVSQNPMPLSDVAPSGSPQTAPTTDAGVGDTRKNQVATNLTEMAKTTIGAAQHLADQGTSIAKNKWKDVGGTEGVKQKAKTYVEAVKHGFAPDEGAKGVGQVTSRVKNLWRSSKYGKVTIIAASLILCWLLFGGGGSSRNMTKEEWKAKVNKEFPGFLIQNEMPDKGKFLSAIGKPTKTQSINGDPWWYYQCSDGMIQMELRWGGPKEDKMALWGLNEY